MEDTGFEPKNVTIVVRENWSIVGEGPCRAVLAKLKFNGYIDQPTVGKLLDFLGNEIYSEHPVTYEIKINGFT